MRLPLFDYQAPDDLNALLAAKAALGPAATVIAGGTDLVPRLRHGLARPETVLSLKKLTQLDKIESDPVFVIIGANATLADLIGDPLVGTEFPGLVEAVTSIGAPSCQRASAGLVGNLLAETRCNHYNQSALWRQGLDRCLKAGGQACLAQPEAKECTSNYLSDGGLMLAALSAQIDLADQSGRRRLPIGELFSGSGEHPFTLTDAEIVTHIRLPRPTGPQGQAYEKLTYRSALDYPLVSAAAVISLSGAKVDRCRLIVGGAGPAPLVVARAGDLLQGREPTEDLIAAAAEAAGSAAAGKVIDNTFAPADYRRRMIPIMAGRALKRAATAALTAG